MSERERESKSSEGERGPKKSFSRRRKTCPFSGEGAIAIDWKDPRMLGKFLSERGKMVPSRITAVSQKKQRKLAQAIKRARQMALIAPVRVELDYASRPPREDRGDRPSRFERSNEERG